MRNFPVNSVPNSFTQLINGDYPDFFEVEYLHTKIVLNQNHFYGFYLYRGQVKSVSPLIMKSDQYEYQAELEDELGSITLHSPRFSDERSIYQELAVAHNNESIIELMVFITPFPDIDKSGGIVNANQTIITIWPVKLRVIEKPSEDAEFIPTDTEWQVCFRGHLISYPSEDGFHYLHSLLEKPDNPLTSGELYIKCKGLTGIFLDPKLVKDFIYSEKAKDNEIKKKYNTLGEESKKTIDLYKNEIRKLKTKIESLNKDVDTEKLSKYHAEIKHFHDAIFFEFRQKFQEGGSLSDIAKKSRPSVTKAVWRAVVKIEAKQPVMGAILRRRVKTGGECCYYDDINHPINWST